jgi:preprotein translocase subunit SecF
MNMKKQESYGKFDFVGKSVIFGSISGALVVLSLIYLGVRGINWGIDFLGGTEVQVKFESPVKIDTLRSLVDKQSFVDPGIQSIGDDKEYIIRFQLPPKGTEKEINQINRTNIENLKIAINQELAAQKPEFRRVDSVGPQVGAELKRNVFISGYVLITNMLPVPWSA